MSTNTLLLAGKPGTGKLAPGKVTPLKGVKAKPELTQQLVVKQAAPHTPEIPHWKGDFPFPKDIVYHDERDGKLIADLKMTVESKRIPAPNGLWGSIQAMEGLPSYPKFTADIEKMDGKFRLVNAKYLLKIWFTMVSHDSPSWVSGWNQVMEVLVGKSDLSIEERRDVVFRHEMDHFSAWSHYFRFMLGKIFAALNAEFSDRESANTRINELDYNSCENFLVAYSRSGAFDEPRGAPQCGGKYGDFPYGPDEQYLWQASDQRSAMKSGVLSVEMGKIYDRRKPK